MTTGHSLSVLDYVVFAVFLLLSLGIGVYHAVRGRLTTTQAVLLGNKQLGVVTSSLALAATFMSAISLLGFPAEFYANGTMMYYYGAMYFISFPLAAFVFLPVLYNLRLTSAYESLQYLELRFDRSVRLTASAIFSVQTLLYMSVVLYAPALALSSVSSLGLSVTILTTGLLAAFYSAIGGAKAVVHASALQMVAIIVGLSAVVVSGAARLGGAAAVLSIALNGSRIHFDDFRVDPLVRHSFWSLMIGGTFTVLSLFTSNQMTVQKYLSMPNLKAAQRSLILNAPFNLLAVTLYLCIGLILYATYHECDPRNIGAILRADQLLPYYVMDQLGSVVGLPGLFIAALYGAGLSTLAGGCNALSAVLFEDLFKPLLTGRCCVQMSDNNAARLTQLLSMVVGCVCVGVAFGYTRLKEHVLQVALSIFGVAGGPLFGLLVLGACVPVANARGALCGALVATATTGAVAFGAIFARLRPVSLPVGGCSNETSSHARPINFGRMLDKAHVETGGVFALSYQYYSLLGTLVCLVVGVGVSAVTGFSKPKSVHQSLLIAPLRSLGRPDEIGPPPIDDMKEPVAEKLQLLDSAFSQT